MVSTFTTNLILEKQAAGENTDTWGSKINTVLDLLDDAIAGRLSKSVAGSSNVTLTAAEARNAWHEYNGTLTGNINVIVPTTEKLYYIFNNTAGAFTLTVKTSGGSGIVVAQGDKVILYADGTNVIEATSTFPDPMTTRGDIIFRNATVPARLAVGAANTALTSDGTDPAWGSITGPYIVLGSDAEGDLILRGGSDYARLAIGAANTVLGSNGTTASWAKVDGPNIAMGSDAQGDFLYYNGTNYVRLAAGTSGKFLQTKGGAANPVWSDGNLVQRVGTQTGAVATGTTAFPIDDSIPAKTEGDEYMTLAITPKNTNNKLVIDVVFIFAHTSTLNMGIGLFQDAVTDALAAAAMRIDAADSPWAIHFQHTMTAGGTSSTTFKVRAGGGTGATMTFNGVSGARLMAGVMASSITIREYLP